MQNIGNIFKCLNLVSRISPLSSYVLYFTSLSSVGFAILKSFDSRGGFRPRNIDMFFTSVSASTVSSMSTLEMEVFSNGQLLVMMVLMLAGGEVFTSLLDLHFSRKWSAERKGKVESVESGSSISKHQHPSDHDPDHDQMELELGAEASGFTPSLRNRSMKFLHHTVLCYFVGIQVLGVGSVLLYMSLVPGARSVLRSKGLKTATFATFTVVSTFANCGFVPTNENMVVFSENSGLLLLLIPQILLGNTLFPAALRLAVWAAGRKFSRAEARYLLDHTREAGYAHLLPGLHSALLAATVFGFILISFVLFCSLEWDSPSLNGLNAYQKVVGVIFQCTNARHTGETIVDLSAVAPAVLVVFVLMMYLPPYTSYLPIESAPKKSGGSKKGVAERLIFSQLTYLVIFIALICITERKSLKQDPLNFSVLNIVVEVISAYGNVGFTTGYSCDRQIKMDPKCVTKWYGFSGKWSDEGKIVLIFVMFFGRLKKFNTNGGRAWKLL